jgi:electron transfer flavoprotein alpha subunit
MTVLVISEHRRGELRDISYELLTVGRELADETGGDLHAAVISGPVDEYADDLNREGVDTIQTVDYGEEFNHDVYVQAIEQLADELDASYILTPHSVNGMDYAPAVAQRLDIPVVTDAVGIETEDGLTVTRELYGGKTEGTFDVDADSAIVTIRGTEWPAVEAAGDAAIEAFDADIDEDAIGTTISGYEEVGAGDVDISESDLLVAVGRGIEEEENLDVVEGLADALGADLAASRPVVDNDWLPEDRQVGQSGKTVSPDVYIAVGISGAVQHVAGMKGAETIIAINEDESAPIFDVADYGIVDDLFDVVPALKEEYAG